MTSTQNTLFKPAIVSVVTAVSVFVLDDGLDYLFAVAGGRLREMLFVSDGITAAIIGLLTFYVLRLHQLRQAELRERLERIVEMNHHVRNALQVITFWAIGDRDKTEIQIIKDAVDRIQWALSEVLARGVDLRQAAVEAARMNNAKAS